MTPLEQRYRRLLLLLPAYYRRAWEEDMVATFLGRVLPEDEEDAEVAAECGGPRGADMARVVVLAARLRLGGPGASPRHRVWGAAVRRAALLAFLAHAVLALFWLGIMGWVAIHPPSPPMPDSAADVTMTPPLAWLRVQAWVTLLWVPAYVVLVGGHRRAARVLALLPPVVSLGWATTTDNGVFDVFLAENLCRLLLAVIPVLALSAFHDDAPPLRRRPWLTALPVGVILTAVTMEILARYLPYAPPLVDLPAVACVLVCGAGISYLVALGTGWGRPGAAWPAALMLLALGVLALRMATLLPYEPWSAALSPPITVVFTAGVVEAGVTLIMTAALVRAARQALRTLPPDITTVGTAASRR